MTSSATLKIQLTLKRSHDYGAVYRKQDGGRFDNSVTLKLNANTKYCLSVTTRPARPVRQMVLKSEKLDLEAQKGERSDDNCLVYQADWSTVGMEVNKSSTRVYVPVVIELEDGACLDTRLQVKIYPETETTHSRWGQEFHLLNWDCCYKPSQPVISIQKEEYL
ncbi:unnamed protein product [Candidula unifasciata]|uniref:CB1 cannabinoid receptor-interacting protein 1 n=1 Tax=Candidula unifasciata TaxID=100452 RepID=A0A8S3ZWY0_9EUPU|nr:unnamed protein product [Candidula unifasciata]